MQLPVYLLRLELCQVHHATRSTSWQTASCLAACLLAVVAAAFGTQRYFTPPGCNSQIKPLCPSVIYFVHPVCSLRPADQPDQGVQPAQHDDSSLSLLHPCSNAAPMCNICSHYVSCPACRPV